MRTRRWSLALPVAMGLLVPAALVGCSGRVTKFRPKPGADPSKLVGQEQRYRSTSTND